LVVELLGKSFDAPKCELFEFWRTIEALDVEGKEVGDGFCLADVLLQHFIVEHEEIYGLCSHLLPLHNSLQGRPSHFPE
jgi:hypothetical protein